MKDSQIQKTSGVMFASFAKRVLLGLAAAGALFAATMTSWAQQIYLDNFNNTDDRTNWVVLFGYTMTDPNAYISNNLVVVGFDYTTLGLPIAPHSVEFGSDSIHKGLKMSACYTNPPTQLHGNVVTGLSACPTNFSITANFVMHADMWVNVDCSPYPVTNTDYTSASASFADNNHDSGASTVFYGCGYGTAGTSETIPGHTDAIWVGMLTDNGSGANVRMYGPSVQGSYQDFVYQESGITTPAFPGDPLVYNLGNGANGLGTRNLISTTANPPYTSSQMSTNLATGVAWRDIFPPSPCPLAQQILYPQQTNNYSLPGFCTFGWHDVSVEKIGNVIIYKIDGNILATGNTDSAGTLGGSFLTFVASRTSTGVLAANNASVPVYTNLNYVIFANIVVSNYSAIVNVSATTPTCQEGQPANPGVFTITRPSAGVPLTVNYTLTGSATNGSQYQLLATNVTFASTATQTNIYVTPIDDGISSPTRTVVLTLVSGTDYVGAGSAIVNIFDGDTPTIDISSATGAQAYGRYTNSTGPGNNADFIPYTLTRRGKLTTGSDLTVNLSYSGSAVSGSDFAPVSSVTMPDGVASVTNQIVPVDDPNVTSNRTVTISVASVPVGAVGNGTASGTIVSAHYAVTSPVLLSDPLTNSADATNWRVVYGCGDPLDDAADFSADFGMNLGNAGGGIPIPPPPNGNGYALHLTCNKNGAPSSPGAVNAYFTNLVLSGNFAVRFNMNIVEGQVPASSSEGPVFGINHTGTCSNWWYGTGFITNGTWSSDGIWYYINAEPAGAARGDYQEYAGVGGLSGGVVTNVGWINLANSFQTSFTQVFKDSDTAGPFTAFDVNGHQTPGVPANESPAVGYDASTWSDVEIKQVDGVVTMSINHTPIFAYTNTTAWTNGYLMLGYEDPFGASIGTSDAGVYYANLQVVQLPAIVPSVITINSIAISGGNVVIVFTTNNGADTTSSFTLRSSSTVNGTYTDVSPAANITLLGSNQFQATTPYTGGTEEFYRVHHN
jgi:Calx-beta domain